MCVVEVFTKCSEHTFKKGEIIRKRMLISVLRHILITIHITLRFLSPYESYIYKFEISSQSNEPQIIAYRHPDSYAKISTLATDYPENLNNILDEKRSLQFLCGSRVWIKLLYFSSMGLTAYAVEKFSATAVLLIYLLIFHLPLRRRRTLPLFIGRAKFSDDFLRKTSENSDSPGRISEASIGYR